MQKTTQKAAFETRIRLLEMGNTQAVQRAVELGKQVEDYRARLTLSEKHNIEQRARIDDLKVKLDSAQKGNDFMRGYVARIREDDVVREELVMTGGPDEQRLVPKRKHTGMPCDEVYAESSNGLLSIDKVSEMNHLRGEWPGRGRKHWVTY